MTSTPPAEPEHYFVEWVYGDALARGRRAVAGCLAPWADHYEAYRRAAGEEDGEREGGPLPPGEAGQRLLDALFAGAGVPPAPPHLSLVLSRGDAELAFPGAPEAASPAAAFTTACWDLNRALRRWLTDLGEAAGGPGPAAAGEFRLLIQAVHLARLRVEGDDPARVRTLRWGLAQDAARLVAAVAQEQAAAGGRLRLPDGVAGQPYPRWLAQAGPRVAVGATVVAGALPPGLTLHEDGLLLGSATRAGDYAFTVRTIDAWGDERTLAYRLVITPVPTKGA